MKGCHVEDTLISPPKSPTVTLSSSSSSTSIQVSSKNPIMASTEASDFNKPFNFAQNCLFLTSSILQNNPFLKPNLLSSPNAVVRQLHTSVTSVADQCFKFLHVFATHNPLLSNILSFSSGLGHHFAQIQCCRLRNANSLSNHSFAAVLPDSAASLVVTNGILNFLNIYNTLLVVRLVLTWFPNSPPAIVSPLSTLCDPYLNIFRGIIPPLGGTLDLSPILAFLVLNAFTSTASALPAELPKTEASQENHSSNASFTASTSSQEKWLRRIHGNKSN